MSVLLFVAGVVVVAIALAWLAPDATERFFVVAWQLKGYMLTILGVAFIGAFISTGNPVLMFVGAIGVALFVWYVWFEADPEVSFS